MHHYPMFSMTDLLDAHWVPPNAESLRQVIASRLRRSHPWPARGIVRGWAACASCRPGLRLRAAVKSAGRLLGRWFLGRWLLGSWSLGSGGL